MAKKKLSERIREDIEKNKEESENLKKQANEDFVKRFGNGDTNPSHTTTYKNIINAMDNNNAKQDFKKRNNLTLWDQIKALASGGGYIARKTGAGAVGGVVGIGQAGLTDTANQLRKGEQSKNSVVKNITNALIGLTNPSLGISNVIDSNKDIISTLLDKNKNNVEKITDIFTKSASNSLDMLPFKQTSNNILQAVGKINNQMDDEVLKLNEGISKPVENINTKLQEEGNQYGEATKWLGDVGQTVGNMIPSIAGSVVTKNPSVGLGAMGLSAKGQSTTEALKKGVDIEKAVDIGNAKALIEIATEKLAGGVKFFGKGNLDDLAEEFIKKGSKSTFGKFLMKQGYNVSGEITEELISNIADNMIDKGTTDPNKKIIDLKEGIDTIGKTALSTLILNGLGGYQQDYNDAKQQTLEQQKQFKDYNIGKAVDENTQKTMEQAQEIIKQNQDNKVINQETKTSQNGFSQEQNTMKAQTSSNLDKVKKFYDEDTFNQMKQFVETAPNENALKQINEDIKTETRNKLEETYKSEKFTESQERKKTFAKYQRENNTNGIQYNSDVVNNALDAVSANRNGRRTVEQWKKVANQIGIEASNLSKAEIEKIAYGSWFDVEPTKNITRYDNQTKTNKPFERFTSDDWVNTIYESAKAQKIQQLETALATEQYSLSSPEIQNNYEYKQSDNTKVDTFRQDASKFWDNSEKTTKLVNTIEKVINDKGYNIRLDDTLGENVNGKIVTNSNGEIEITLNPNSSRAGEFILGHELTHAIQTQEMVDLVNQRMQKDGDLKNAVEDLKKLYNTDDINAEVLADISGQLFGNQEFINNLSIEKPSVFKRIYDKIVSLANKITGNSSEALFIKDLKNKWEKAYRENTNNINVEQYSIETDAKGYKYVKADRQVISGNDPEVWKTQTQNYIDEQIRKNKDVKVYAQDGTELTITKNTSGKATFRNEVRQADGTIRKLTDEEFASKLRAETHIDELGEVSKHKNGPVPDTKNHSFAKDGFNYRTAYFEDEDGQYYKITMSVGKNGDINTIYNVGKMQQAQKNRSKSTNSELKGSNGNDTANSRIASINSIPQTQENVNSDTTNYSMQESENNSGSFNLSENKRFDVTGNENLDKSGTLFFRTREDGIYYVQATDHSGDLIYEGTFLDKKSLSRTLGEDIANYIVENSEKTNNEIYIENNGNIKSETDYMMRHRPSEEYGNGSNFEKNMDGVFEHPQWYMNMNEDWNVESLNALRRIRNKPDAEITIYRATPGKKINPGDWVTPSKKYAELHNNSQLDGKGNILELKVKAKDILWGGDDINEFGYYPNNGKYSKQNNNWQDYLESNYKSEGTTTDLRDIRLPMKEKQEVKAPIKQSQENTKIKFNNEVMKTNSEIKGNSETSEKVAKILSEPTKNVKPEQRTWAILKANFIDKGAVFEKISQKTNNRDLQGKYDYTLTAGARGQYAIGNDRYVYSNGKKTLQSKSLTSIIDEVGENTQAFNEYMYHQLNVDRMTLDERFGIENKPVFGDSVTADVSRAEIAKIEEQHPEFKKYANDVYKYLETNKQELVDRGVISQETSDFFKERYPHYVPIQRATRKGNSIDVALDTKRTGINSPIKKAKGGNQDINPLFQTMASQTLQTYRASARNNFGLELKNTLQQMNQLNENRAIADIDDIVDTMTNEEQNNELLQPGKKGENPTFTVFEDGKKITYDISQDMYDALKPKSEILNKLDNTKASKVARKISNFRRGVLTEYNPIFSITNALKDAQDVLINSQHSAKTYAKFPEAYAQIVKKGYWYNEYIQNGGEQNSYFTEGDFENIKKTKLDKAKNVLKIPFEKISSINNVIEMAPRLAEYIVSRQNGANIETAMLDASRVTTNFKAGGDITKFANRNGATFLNASVQGFQQQVRNIQEANMKGLKGWTNLALKYTVAGLPALLLNNLFWDDDDDYEQLQDYVKDNYYVIAKLPNGNFLRIPKGRMVATIQKVVSNANDFVKDGKINSDEVASTIWNDLKEDIQFGADNLAPNNPIDNNILSPIIQVAQNKTWYGDDLVPQRLQDVPAPEQADESTDKLSRWLGEKLNVSPIKINYLLDQYSGGIGDVLLPMGTPQAENNVIEDKFTTDPVMKSQYPSDFFSKKDELNIKNNSLKATDEDKIKYKYISSVQSDISELYKQKREIQASDKSDKVKKQELKEVQKQINKLAKEGIENVEKVNISGGSATVGEQQYYKNKDTWTKLTDKDKEKLKDTNLSTYSSYKQSINDLKSKKIANGELEEGNDLSDKDKIQLLRDSNYSQSEKSNLYEKTISTDKYYSTLKKSGIDIDEYMDYKLAQSNGDFTADKKNGKTVMRKRKTESYRLFKR